MNPDTRLQKLPPLPLARGLSWFRTLLIRLNKRLFPGNVVLYEQLQYFWLLPSLYVAARLDIATLLGKGRLSLADLARQTATHGPSLYRVLRALASQGIFHEHRDGSFSNTRLSKALLEERGSLRHTLLHHLGPVNWNLMSNLIHAVQTGGDPFSNLYGMPIYTYLQNHPGEYELFDRSMSNLSDLGLAPILHAYDFSNSGHIADMGGGEGYLLANILVRNPGSRGTLFDLPEATAKAAACLSPFGLSGRISISNGNFFSDPVPPADLYILKNIIHNWNDRECLRLLQNIGNTMKTGARILIIDMIVGTANVPSPAPLLDIQMLACMEGGRERTRNEFNHLLQQAGFRITRIVPTLSPISLIEAQPEKPDPNA